MRDYVREPGALAPRPAQVGPDPHPEARPAATGAQGPAADPRGSLPENLETIRRQLARRAEAMREEGPLELDEDLV